jgi:glycosyltransferase involved in cell wall biosynthesis
MAGLMAVSIIIPTKDMPDDLQLLLQGLEREQLFCHEVIVVNDGSAPATTSLLASWGSRVKVIHHSVSQGRYLARLAGARAARNTHLLFLDTRCEVPGGFAAALASHCHLDVVQGSLEIPAQESLYNLYWERSHRFMFRHHFRALPGGFWLTPAIFSQHVVGTTIFFCRQDIFLTACASFSAPPLSDDTALIREICQRHNIWVAESLFVRWRPRQALLPFLGRLWERGPNFVSYHVYGHGSPLRKFFFVGLGLVLANLTVLLVTPTLWGGLALTQLLVLAATTLAFTLDPREFFKLAPLHVAVILAFGLGVLKGLWTEFPRRQA